MSLQERRVRVDAHHHVWRYTPEEFAWLQGDLAPLRRDFMSTELLSEMRSAMIAATVAVQARQSVGETAYLLDLANATPEIAGVVGWLPIASDSFPQTLEQLQHAGKLKGLRHVVQAEQPGFLDGEAFNRGLRALQQTSLVYDLLLVQHQLAEAIRFVDRHPMQPFVLDHLAKPLIRTGTLEPWTTQLRELAIRPNVVCKVSGMVTEAGSGWTVEQLQPFFDVVLNAFGPKRLMVGSDWPVLTAHCSYGAWWRIVEEWTGSLTEPEQVAILGDTAIRTYGLSLPRAVGEVYDLPQQHVA